MDNWEMSTDLWINRILGIKTSLRTYETRAIEATFRKDHHWENRVIGTGRWQSRTKNQSQEDDWEQPFIVRGRCYATSKFSMEDNIWYALYQWILN